jgi:hypothetical protein
MSWGGQIAWLITTVKCQEEKQKRKDKSGKFIKHLGEIFIFPHRASYILTFKKASIFGGKIANFKKFPF